MKLLEKDRIRANFLRELARDLQQEHGRSQYHRLAAELGDAQNSDTAQHSNANEAVRA